MDPVSIDEELSSDHERLNSLIQEVERLVAPEPTKAVERFKVVIEGLENHMMWEEKTLFPAVSRYYSPQQLRSIESLKIDHEQIHEILEELEGSLCNDNTELSLEYLNTLNILLEGHNYDEEHGVYEDADRMLSEEERKACLKGFEPGMIEKAQ